MSTGSSQQTDMTNHWILRFVALIIDSIIFGIITYILFYLVIVPLAFTGSWWLLYGWGYSWLILTFLLGVLELVYFVLMESSSGATVGKKIMGLEVQMVNGGKVPFDKAFIRNISKIWVLFLLLDWIVGFATSGSDPRQKYTDRIAGTTVVSIKQAFAAPPPPPPPPPPPS